MEILVTVTTGRVLRAFSRAAAKCAAMHSAIPYKRGWIGTKRSDVEADKPLHSSRKITNTSHVNFQASLRKTQKTGTSVVVQWLRLRASTAGGTGLILGWEAKIPHPGPAKKKKSQKVT